MRKLLTAILLFLCIASYGQFGVLVGNFQEADEIPTDGLIAYYPFNGNANDESGNGNHATVNGATLDANRFGEENSAYNFFEDDWIATPVTMNFRDTFSISMWMERSSTDSLLYSASDNNPFVQIGVFSDDKIYVTARSGSGFPTAPCTNTDWFHVVYVFAGGGATSDDRNKVYINGILQTLTGSSTATSASSSSGTFDIGRRNNGDIYSTGRYDDVAIYDVALNQNDVNSLYGQGGWPNP